MAKYAWNIQLEFSAEDDSDADKRSDEIYRALLTGEELPVTVRVVPITPDPFRLDIIPPVM